MKQSMSPEEEINSHSRSSRKVAPSLFQTLGIRAEQSGIMPRPWDVGPDAAHRALMRNLRSDGKRSRSQSKCKQMNAKAHSFIHSTHSN